MQTGQSFSGTSGRLDVCVVTAGVLLGLSVESQINFCSSQQPADSQQKLGQERIPPGEIITVQHNIK